MERRIIITLIQIGHMIAQVIEAIKKLWEGIRQSREQKASENAGKLQGNRVKGL